MDFKYLNVKIKNMIQTPEQPIELFSEYKEEITEIRDIAKKLVDIAMESEELYNPATRFKKYLEEKFTELGIDEPVDHFGAYHYAIGSTPYNQRKNPFDTNDQLILKTLREFLSVQ
jgi:hypothetical protein